MVSLTEEFYEETLIPDLKNDTATNLTFSFMEKQKLTAVTAYIGNLLNPVTSSRDEEPTLYTSKSAKFGASGDGSGAGIQEGVYFDTELVFQEYLYERESDNMKL